MKLVGSTHATAAAVTAPITSVIPNNELSIFRKQSFFILVSLVGNLIKFELISLQTTKHCKLV